MHSGILFGLTVLLGQLCVSNGVKCYKCTYSTFVTSVSTPACNEGANFNGQNMTIEDCNGECGKIRGGAGSSLTLTRACYSSAVCTGIHAGGSGMFCCSTDYCNDTWQMKASLVGALAAVLAAYLLRAV